MRLNFSSILITFSLSASIFISASSGASAQAIGSGMFDLGGKYNPIYVQPVYTLQQINQQRILQLQMLYGITAYNSCASGSYMPYDPTAAGIMITAIQACLQQSSSAPTITSPISCPPLSRSYGSVCMCNDGSFAQNGSCATLYNSTCRSDYGELAQWDGGIRNGQFSCTCAQGAALDGTTNKCAALSSSCPTGQVSDGTGCITYTAGCQKAYGSVSFWNGKFETDGRFICDCPTGYSWNASNTACVTQAAPTPSCAYPSVWIPAFSKCVVLDQMCSDTYGPNSISNGTINANGTTNCVCRDGLVWNVGQTECIQSSTSSVSTATDPVKVDLQLTTRLKGYILLQTQSHGEAWYVRPETGTRFYMKDGATAYQMMRSFGLGVSEADYTKIAAGNLTLKTRLRGKIILRPQAHGEAYYIDPKNLAVYYLQNGDEAYRIMRLYSLGISNVDLGKIAIGNL